MYNTMMVKYNKLERFDIITDIHKARYRRLPDKNIALYYTLKSIGIFRIFYPF